MLESRLVQAGDVRLEAYEAGPADSPQTMVLVHGATSSARIWHEVQQLLAHEGVHTVAVGMRGAGASDRAERQEDYRPEVYAADLAAAVRTLGLERFTLVGHSLGGRVVARYALDHDRERVQALVLLAAVSLRAREGGAGPRRARPATYEAWEPNHLGLPPEVRRALWADIQANPPERAEGQRLASEPDHLDRLAALELPVLLLAGDRDSTLTLAPVLETYLALAPERRRLHVLYGVEHFPNAQAPAEVAGTFARFVQEHVPSGAG